MSKILNNYIFNGWVNQPTVKKKIEREVRIFIRKYVKKYQIKLNELDKIYIDIIGKVENYGKAS